jgi:ParB family chromosome partitioning protein
MASSSSIYDTARARSPHAPLELMREIINLKAKGYNTTEIAKKINLAKSYVIGISHLLEHWEERLLAAVDKGRVPLSAAMQISTDRTHPLGRSGGIARSLRYVQRMPAAMERTRRRAERSARRWRCCRARAPRPAQSAITKNITMHPDSSMELLSFWELLMTIEHKDHLKQDGLRI